jgi:hypothetical protein
VYGPLKRPQHLVAPSDNDVARKVEVHVAGHWLRRGLPVDQTAAVACNVRGRGGSRDASLPNDVANDVVV